MSRPLGFHDLPFHIKSAIIGGETEQARSRRSANRWREAYETLARQTGRTIDDGLGLDPRSPAAMAKKDPQ